MLMLEKRREEKNKSKTTLNTHSRTPSVGLAWLAEKETRKHWCCCWIDYTIPSSSLHLFTRTNDPVLSRPKPIFYLVVSASADTNRLIFIFIFFNISYTLYGNLQVYLIAALDEVVH